MNYIKEYYNKMEAGEIVANRRLKEQYRRLYQNVDVEKDGFIYDHEKAIRPIEFIETFCKHSKGQWAGQPVKLELFQKAFISALYGFVDKETGKRQYREAFFFVARKNGKSTLLAGLALYMLIADKEAGAEVYSLASKRDQAKILYEEAHNMIKQSEYLAKHIRKRKSDLYFSKSFSKFMPLSKNSNSLDGLNAHLAIIDELHSITDRNQYEVVKQSQSARAQPLLIMITTAGTQRAGIFDTIYDYAKNLTDGNYTDNTFLPIMYELDDREEWTEPSAWQKANPALGTIKSETDLYTKVKRAKKNTEEKAGVLTKDFNIRETLSNAWLTFQDINNTETFKLEDMRGSFAIGGADLSITTDLTCATLLMIDPATEKRFVEQMYFLPADNFTERVEDEKIPYDKWLEQGLLRLCNGNSIVYGDITAWFLEIIEKYDITPLWVYYDPYSAGYWREEMEMYGFKMIKCYQGAKTLSLPMQQLGQDFKKGLINYNNNPILKWCLTNTGIQEDRNGNIVPVKNNNPKMRIDGTASLLDAYVGLLDRFNEFKESM